MQASLAADEIIIEYYAARGALCACLIGPHSFDIVPLGGLDDIREHAQLLQFQLSKFRLGPDYQRQFAPAIEAATTAHLQALYQRLIAPVRDRLDGRSLIVVPHGFLHYVPFHALHDGAAYLIDAAPICYAPSASVLHLCRQKRGTQRHTSLVLGVSDEATPHIDAEVNAVAAALPRSRVFRGRRATVARLQREPEEPAAVVEQQPQRVQRAAHREHGQRGGGVVLAEIRDVRQRRRRQREDEGDDGLKAQGGIAANGLL